MGISAAQTFVGMIGSFVVSFFGKLAEALMRTFGNSFSKEEVVLKAAISFVASIGYLGFALFTMPLSLWMLAIIPVGTIGGAMALTGLHFISDVVVASAKNVWSTVKSFFSAAKATAEA